MNCLLKIITKSKMLSITIIDDTLSFLFQQEILFLPNR